jgi:hypothetical protein
VTVTGRRVPVVTMAILPLDFLPVPFRAHQSFSLIYLGLPRKTQLFFVVLCLPERSNPHETCTFCTSLKKNRVFPFIFAVSHLRSHSAFAIVAHGPSFTLINSGFSLVADLDSFGVDRQFRRISRLNGS